MKRLGLLLSFVTISFAAIAANPKISEHAVYPITKKGYPKLYAEWGAAKIKEMNALMPRAAEKVASSPECNKVELVELSGQRSSPKGDIVLFVDCANGKRFYVSKVELKGYSAPQSQQQKMSSITDHQATAACENAIKAQLTNSMTFEKKLGSNSVYRAPTTGNIAVEFTFEAKNSIGGVLPNKARCVFNDKGLQDAIISK